jgi:hypothetical protein
MLAFVTQAKQVAYPPTVPADWNPVPANVQAALDQLAADNPLKALLQGGNSFGAPIQAGTNDNFYAMWGAFTAVAPQAFVKADPNGGAPVLTVDTVAGGTINIAAGATSASSANLGNNVGTSTTTIQGHLLQLTSTNKIALTVPQTTLNPSGGVTQLFSLFDNAGTNYVGFRAPTAIASNVTWTLPNADATVPGQVLTSNAAGVLTWTTSSGSGGLTLAIFQSGGPGGAANVFTSWAALNAAIEPGSTVLIDFTFDDSPTVPTGSWPNVYRLGTLLPKAEPYADVLFLNVADGAVFPNLSYVEDFLTLNCLAKTVIPIIRGDDTVFVFQDGGGIQKDPTATLPAMQLTPDDGDQGPYLFAYDSGIIGSGTGDIEIAPLDASANQVYVAVRNSVIASAGPGVESIVSGGPFAADSDLFFQILDQEANFGNSSFTASTLGSYTVYTPGAGGPVFAYGAATSGTSGTPLVTWLPIGNNATLKAAVGMPDAADSGLQGLLTQFGVSFVGSGTMTGNVATFDLYRSESSDPIPIPSTLVATCSEDVTLSGFNGAVASFVDGSASGTFYWIKITTASALPVAFTQITGGLR